MSFWPRPMKALWLGLAAGLALPAAAWAGPPYVTDDPEPTDRGHWEIYNFANGVHTPGDTGGEGGIDLNYGGFRDTQLTLTLPFAYDRADGHTSTGMGVVEAAAKYKFIHQDKDGWVPDVAVFPRFFLPTAPARFGSRRTNFLLPVWAQKDFGEWSVFGGGGYMFNPGPDNRNFWVSGLTVTRQVTEKLNIGAEVFHQTRDAVDSRPFTGANLGVVYKLSDHWALLGAGGPGLQNARQGGQYQFYFALEAMY